MLKSIKTVQQYIIGSSLILSALLTFNDSPTEPTYIVIISCFLLILLLQIIKVGKKSILNKPLSLKFKLFLLAPLVMIIIWLYGFLLAIINSNELAAASRNFAGMLFYVYFYTFLIARPSVGQVLKFFNVAFFIQIGWALYYIQPYLNGSYVYDTTISISENKAAYSVGFSVFLPYVTYLTFYYLVSLKYRDDFKIHKFGFYYLAILLISIIFSIIPNLSKGFFLALIISFIFPVIYILYLSIIRLRWSFGVVGGVMLLTIFGLSVDLIYTYWDQFVYTFSTNEQSNAERSYQFNYLINDMSLLGNGLGSIVRGYHRTDYGLELTYMSLIHKFGFIGIFVVCYILITYYYIIKNLFLRRDIFKSLFAFGLMLYTIPAAGNPLLFSPLMVIFHCFAIYLMIEVDDKKSKFAKV